MDDAELDVVELDGAVVEVDCPELAGVDVDDDDPPPPPHPAAAKATTITAIAANRRIPKRFQLLMI